jgi:hypothetical protein
MALPADAIHITYTAPAGCPSDAAFLWQVRSRVREVHALATRYEIVVTSDARQVRGVLRVQEESRETVRHLTGASCEEVAEGLALIMALLIDPGASTAPARDLPPATPPASREPVQPPKLPPPEGLPEPSDTAVALHPSPPPSPPPSRHVSLEAGGVLFLRNAIAPGVNASGGPFVETEILGSGLVSPRLRMSVEFGSSQPVFVGDGRADFSWTTGILDSCAVVQLVRSRLALPLCVGLDFGRIVATGSHVPDPQTERKAWLSIDTTARVDWSPADGSWFLELDAGAQTPLYRARFYFSPSTTLYTTPKVAAFAGIGVGLRLF